MNPGSPLALPLYRFDSDGLLMPASSGEPTYGLPLVENVASNALPVVGRTLDPLAGTANRITPNGYFGQAGYPIRRPRVLFVSYPFQTYTGYNPDDDAVFEALEPTAAALGIQIVGGTDRFSWLGEILPRTSDANSVADLSLNDAALYPSYQLAAYADPAWYLGGDVLYVRAGWSDYGGSPTAISASVDGWENRFDAATNAYYSVNTPMFTAFRAVFSQAQQRFSRFGAVMTYDINSDSSPLVPYGTGLYSKQDTAQYHVGGLAGITLDDPTSLADDDGLAAYIASAALAFFA